MEQTNTHDDNNNPPPAYNSLFSSATTQEQPIMLICTKCGLSVTDELQHIGGDENCKHQMKPPSISRPQIVYPTQSELKWIESIENNKSETASAITQFENDLNELNKLKTQCQYEINLTIQQLKQTLTERQTILNKQVEDLYTERKNAIQNCIQQLSCHQKNNIEVKDDAEDKLLHSTDTEKRELEIIQNCKKSIDSTPNLQYIPIGISMIFTAFSHIQDTINNLGRLKNGGPIDSGKVVMFESQLNDNNNDNDNDDEYIDWNHEQQIQHVQVKPEVKNAENDVHDVQPKLAISLSKIVGCFDMNKQQIRLTMKISDNYKKQLPKQFEEKEKCDLYQLYVEIRCVAKNGNDTTEISENDFVDAIYGKIYKISELYMTNKKKYILFVDYKFGDGDEIGIQLRLQYKSSETEVNNKLKWSKIICVSIPDESEQSELENNDNDNKNDNNKIFYLITLNDEMKQLSYALSAVNDMQFEEFKNNFLDEFDTEIKDDEMLILSASSLTGDGNDIILCETMETNMSQFDSSKFMIKGNIEKEKRKQNMDMEKKLPKTIIFIVNCMDETKKKIVLKRKNGYTMDSLNKTLRERLKDDKPYWLQCDNTIIREDKQIIEYLQNNPSCFLVPKNN